MIPIAAICPGFLSIPPNIFLFALNLVINYLDPTTREPIGVHNPLLRQNITESQSIAISFGSMPN